jgi:hypothetical protein
MTAVQHVTGLPASRSTFGQHCNQGGFAPESRGEWMSMTVEQLEHELRDQPEEVRHYLASMLVDTLDSPGVDDDAIEADAHRRYLQMESGEEGGIDGEEAITQLRARRNLVSFAPGHDLLPEYSLKGASDASTLTGMPVT